VTEQLSELDRQVARTSARIADSNSALQAVRAAETDLTNVQTACLNGCPTGVTAADCRTACVERTHGAALAAENKGAVFKQTCQGLEQTITAMNSRRSELLRACPAAARTRPASLSSCIH
jgi:hypothetical protein